MAHLAIMSVFILTLGLHGYNSIIVEAIRGCTSRRVGIGSYIVDLKLVSLLQSFKGLEVIIVTRRIVQSLQ